MKSTVAGSLPFEWLVGFIVGIGSLREGVRTADGALGTYQHDIQASRSNTGRASYLHGATEHRAIAKS
jgi:hypothetical protein